MKTTLTATLSKDSFNQLANKVLLYGQKFQQGVELGVQEATKQCYELIVSKMEKNNLSNHIGNVICDEELGRIYTTDIIIMFHEFGTGIKGTQDEWASVFGYTVNESGKGEDGWFFKNETEGYYGITHGLTTKHIFYESLLEIQPKLVETISISVSKTIGAMY